jgi:hypothetical protein
VFGSGGRPSRTIVDAMRTEGVERYIGMATPSLRDPRDMKVGGLSSAVSGREPRMSACVTYRSDLNAARTSPANKSGSSHAAKWPPLSTSWK